MPSCRSQSALLAVNKNIGGGIGGGRRKWPKGKDFLFATWAFVIGKEGKTKEGIAVSARSISIPSESSGRQLGWILAMFHGLPVEKI